MPGSPDPRPHRTHCTHYALHHLTCHLFPVNLQKAEMDFILILRSETIPYFFFFSVMFSSLCMDWSDDQRYPSVPFAPFLSICTFIGRDSVRLFCDSLNRLGQWEAMAGKYLKWPAVLRRAKWSSAWWRTCKALWHHICVCYLQQHRKKNP